MSYGIMLEIFLGAYGTLYLLLNASSVIHAPDFHYPVFHVEH